MVKPKKMATGARHADPGTSRDEDDLEIVPSEGHKEDLTGPTVFFFGGGGAILVESCPSSVDRDMRREIEQLEELLILNRKHGEPLVKGPDPPVVWWPRKSRFGGNRKFAAWPSRACR